MVIFTFICHRKTKFYDKAPADNSISTTGLSELYTSIVRLNASDDSGPRQVHDGYSSEKNTQTDGKYDLLGEPLVNADGDDYEYNLYKTAMRNYEGRAPGPGLNYFALGE